MNLPTIRSYGNYSSGNYGVNSLEVSFPNDLTLNYSYETVIAFRCSDIDPDQSFFIRKNDWSTTTGKHLNWINPDKKIRIDGEKFELLLQKALRFHKLA